MEFPLKHTIHVMKEMKEMEAYNEKKEMEKEARKVPMTDEEKKQNFINQLKENFEIYFSKPLKNGQNVKEHSFWLFADEMPDVKKRDYSRDTNHTNEDFWEQLPEIRELFQEDLNKVYLIIHQETDHWMFSMTVPNLRELLDATEEDEEDEEENKFRNLFTIIQQLADSKTIIVEDENSIPSLDDEFFVSNEENNWSINDLVKIMIPQIDFIKITRNENNQIVFHFEE